MSKAGYNVVAQCRDCERRGVTTLWSLPHVTTAPDNPFKIGNSIGIGGKGSCPNCPNGPGFQIGSIVAFAPHYTILIWQEEKLA